MLEITPFTYTEAEYRRLAKIDENVFGTPALPIEEYVHEDQTRRPEFMFRRDWILRDGEPIAFVDWGQNPVRFHPHKVDMRIWVDPPYDAADIRPFFLDYLLQQTAHMDLLAIYSDMRESCVEAIRFFDAYGFVEVARDQLSQLDLTSWDPAAFNDLVATVQDQGIRIVSLRSLQQTEPEAWQEKLFKLEQRISADVPTTDTKQPHSFDSWHASRLTAPTFDADAWFVALDGRTYVGESQGYFNETNPAWFENGLTGVRRQYRRRGIAAATKDHLLRHAKEGGAQTVSTGNESKNPMYYLNLKLGFEPQPAWIRTEKALRSEK